MVNEQESEVYVSFRREPGLLDAVAVVQHVRPVVPDIVEVELPATKPFPRLYAIDNHACHLADAAARIVLHHLLHVTDTARRIAAVQPAQSPDKEELVPVGPHGKACPGNPGIGRYLSVTPLLEGIVGRCIERILYLHAEPQVLFVIGIGKENRPLALRIFPAQPGDVAVCHLLVALPHIKKIEVIVHIVHLFIVRIVVGHAAQGLLGQPEVVEPVLEEHAGMVQTVFQYPVACLQLCWGKRNLCQIVLPLVRIVLQRVSGIVNRILPCLGLQDRVPLLVGQFDGRLRITDPAHDSLVDALPVVDVLPFSP